MADLLAGYGKELSESEGRISSSIQQKIAKQTQAHIDEVVAKMNRSWLVASFIFCNSSIGALYSKICIGFICYRNQE